MHLCDYNDDNNNDNDNGNGNDSDDGDDLKPGSFTMLKKKKKPSLTERE